MSQPAISVIIPTYNRVAYLREALDSVAAQTFRSYEVIVVDDGSTEPIADAIEGHTTSPRVVRQVIQGPAAARNSGIQAATADVVAFLDNDDLWLPEKLARFMEAMRRDPDVPIWYGPMQPIESDGRHVPGRTKPCVGGWITEALFRSSFVHVPTVVCRKELLVDAACFDETLPVCEDYDLWLRLSVQTRFGLIEEPLALRRLHGDRLSKARMSRNLDVKARMLTGFYESGIAGERLKQNRAEARLAKVCFAAGRAAMRNGEIATAARHLRTSRRYGGAGWRVWPWLMVSSALCVFSREVSMGPSTFTHRKPRSGQETLDNSDCN
ncbi:MAG: glycosyltransferase [Planctomycetota bacterium]